MSASLTNVQSSQRRARRTLRAAWPYIIAGLFYGLLTALAFPPFGVWGFALLAPIALIFAAWLSSTRTRANITGSDVPSYDAIAASPTSKPTSAAPTKADAPASILPPALYVGLGAMPLWAFEHIWVIHVTPVGYPFLIILLSVYPALFVASLSWLVRYLPRIPLTILAPIVWVAVEYFRGAILWTGYPWYLAGQPLIDAPGIWSFASIGGTYLISLIVVILGAGGADLYLASRRWWVGPTTLRRRVGLIGLAIVAAFWTLSLIIGPGRLGPYTPASGPTLRVGVVQPNISMDDRIVWDGSVRVQTWIELMELTRRAYQGRPDLIVWPETVFPGGPLNASAVDAQRESGLAWNIPVPDSDEPEQIPIHAFAEAIEEVQRDFGIPMLVGATAVEGLTYIHTDDDIEIRKDRQFNSAFMISGGRILEERYDKLHLTPYGEVIPHLHVWPWFERLMLNVGARGMSFDLSRGQTPTVFVVPGAQGDVRVVTPICFEAATPWVCRLLVFDRGRRRADLMVNLTNDGWFNFADWSRKQHFQVARWRCVELATPMVRAANTGISGVIDARGRVRQQGAGPAALPPQRADVLVVHVDPPGPMTFYARVGDVVGRGSLALSLAGLLAGWVNKRRGRR